MTPPDDRRSQVDRFVFHAVHPHVRFGTASDRYAGWIGSIYPEHYAARIKARKRKLGGQTFEERTLPIASVRDYFDHFGILELDFTFYRPLLDREGAPTNNLYVLEQYADQAPPEARFLLKAPQQFFARRLRRTREGRTVHEDNPDYLDAAGVNAQFLTPARDVLGDRLAGVLFEQEYQRRADSPHVEAFLGDLDAFFSALPGGIQYHLEIRSPHLLLPPYFAWLESRGLGYVFSHWTWLPPLREQWKLCGGRFTAADRTVVARLLTPLRMPYAEAYAAAYPFDRPVPALSETDGARHMVLDATALAFQAMGQGAILNLILNNRAWGHSPSLARAIAYRILDEEARRS